MIVAYGKDGDDGANQRNSVVMFARQIDGPYFLENTGPIANFTVKTDDLKVKVDASESYVLSMGAIMEYLWDWGDGKGFNSSDPNASHTYSSEGKYDITLTVVDSNSMSAKITKSLEVSEDEEGFIESMIIAIIVQDERLDVFQFFIITHVLTFRENEMSFPNQVIHQSVKTEVSIFKPYLSILACKVGRESPNSCAARVRLPSVRFRASLMIVLPK